MENPDTQPKTENEPDQSNDVGCQQDAGRRVGILRTPIKETRGKHNSPKTMNTAQNGKGSHRRKGANDEAYRDGHERIFGKRKSIYKADAEIESMTMDERWTEHERLKALDAKPIGKNGKPSWAHPDFSRCSNDWWKLGICQHCKDEGGCAASLKNLRERLKYD